MALPDHPPTVALLGDSQAYHVVAGLTKYYSSRGENLVYLGTRWPYWGVPPGDDPYQQATQQMLEIALATDSIRTVIFSSHVRLHASTPDGLALVDKVRDTLRRYLAAGKQVIYMDDVPVLSFDPRACIRRAGVASSSTRAPCALPRTEVEAQTPEHGTALANLLKEFPGVALFQTAPQLCDDKLCWAMKDGDLLYRDKDHLSYEGDLYIGKKFAEWQALRGAKQGGKPLQ
jgi:hypothetical protein